MRVECRKSCSLTVTGLALLVAIGSGRAQASPVTISGGFTGFIGQSGGANGFPSTNTSPGCDGSFQGIVAGSVVQATSCTPRLVGSTVVPGVSGPAESTFSSTGSLDFYELQFGADPAGPPPASSLNNLSFTPAPGQEVANTGDLFWMGTISFTNGTWFGTGPVNRFKLELKTSSSNGLFDDKVLSDYLILDIRVGSTPEDNGDCVDFASFTLGLLCAYEKGVPGKPSTVTAQLFGKIGSLIPVEFRDVQGGFLLAAGPVATPEPMSVILVGTGLVAMLRRRLRQ